MFDSFWRIYLSTASFWRGNQVAGLPRRPTLEGWGRSGWILGHLRRRIVFRALVKANSQPLVPESDVTIGRVCGALCHPIKRFHQRRREQENDGRWIRRGGGSKRKTFDGRW